MTTASTGNISMTAGGGVLLTSTTGDVELTAGAGRKIDMFSSVDMFNNNISNVSNITSSTPLTITSGGQLSLVAPLNNDIVVTTAGTGRVVLATAPSGRVEVNNTMRMDGDFQRVLDNPISQPVFQYGTITSTGASGNALVTLTDTYTSTSSYAVQVTMEGTNPAQLSVNRLTTSTFRIYWSSAGGGSHTIDWLAYGV
jgi:hypothetical protein